MKKKRQRLLSALDGSRLQGKTMLALATGMRRGGLLALTWSNVDFAAATVTVRHSLQQSGVSVKAPKSGARPPGCSSELCGRGFAFAQGPANRRTASGRAGLG
jgi:integrase